MSSQYFAVVPAAGAGRRFGADRPKQYLELAGMPVLVHTLARLCQVAALARIVVPVAADDDRWQSLSLPTDPQLQFVTGGAERMHSVLAGLDALAAIAADDDWVLVHDVARPCVRVSDIERLMQALREEPAGGLLANRVRDTMKRSDASGHVVTTVPRDELWHALTPQMFRYGKLRHALQTAVATGELVTDEAQAIERAGWPVRLVEGARDNLKITFPEDLALAASFLRAQEQA